jgi:hypothetical protein
MTRRILKLTPETKVQFSEPAEIQDIHLHDLSFVAGIETEGDLITSCTLDVSQLIQSMTLYSAMEKKRESWRRVKSSKDR